MTIASLQAVGPVRAAELALSARNDVARNHSNAQVATVEVVRPIAASASAEAEPATERLHIDISV